MSDELDRLRSYIAALPPARPEELVAGRAKFEDAMAQHLAQDRQASARSHRHLWRSRVSSHPTSARLLLVLGLAALLTVAVGTAIVVGHTPTSRHPTSSGHATQEILVRLVADDVNVTVASGSYDMTFNDTTTPSPNCSQGGEVGGSPSMQSCGERDALPSISGHGTVDTSPYAMVAISQDGPLGVISLYDNGTDVWEIGGGNYGLAGPRQAGTGAPLSGFAGSVEGTVGQQAGALDMQGLASGTGYLDLETAEIQGAEPAGTGTVTGVPVTIYKLSMTGLQDPDLNGLSAEQIKTIRAADATLQETDFSGKAILVSVDANGYVREVRTTYTLSDGSSVSQDTVLSNFGCAGTVLMPGETGSTAPPAGCVSPDSAGQTPAPTTPPPPLVTAPPSSSTTTSTTTSTT
ncbi:MAG: hypothetical protein ACRDYB_06640 [Acidimicrobiales bacterium]